MRPHVAPTAAQLFGTQTPPSVPVLLSVRSLTTPF
jgi:hypothetical protein